MIVRHTEQARAGDRYQAPTVRKAFDILKLLARSDQGLKLSDLSRSLGISKSTAHGIVIALEDSGAVVRDAGTKRLSLGLALLELGNAVYTRMDLPAVAHPIMESLRGRVGGSVFLGVQSDDHVYILDIAESEHELKITAPVGTRIPLFAGATGKVFMASMTDEEAARLVGEKGLRMFTKNTITDPTRYLDELRTVRRDGFAVDNEEYIPGVRAVASPISSGGRRNSAIWVVGFTPSMSDEKMATTAVETRRAAEAIGRILEGREEHLP